MKISCTRRPLSAALLLVLGLATGTAMAGETCELGSGGAGGATAAADPEAFACGQGAQATDNATAIGADSNATGFAAVAVGLASGAPAQAMSTTASSPGTMRFTARTPSVAPVACRPVARRPTPACR